MTRLRKDFTMKRREEKRREEKRREEKRREEKRREEKRREEKRREEVIDALFSAYPKTLSIHEIGGVF